MRLIHGLAMFAHQSILGAAGWLGHAKARRWTVMRAETKARLTAAYNRLPASERWGWFHCASVGEFEQARPVMEWIREHRPEMPFLVTFYSPSGMDAFENRPPEWWGGHDTVAAIPVDRPRAVRDFLSALTPTGSEEPALDFLALVKYEIWPELLRQLADRNVHTALFAAHVLPGHFPFNRWGSWHRDSWHFLGQILVQDKGSQGFLERYGLASEWAGDPRIDRVWQTVQESVVVRDKALEQWVAGRDCVVAGSTWGPDEKALLSVDWQPNQCLILVPHEWDATRIERLLSDCKSKGLRPVRWSDHRLQKPTNGLPEGNVLIVDAMGFLSRLYRFGNWAVVGGGFGVGIHNTLEPAAHGAAIFTGPNIERFKEALDLRALGALHVAATPDLLGAVLQAALGDEKTGEAGDRAAKYVRENQGAAERIALKILGQ